jgi:histidinol dehydrogenase
LRITAVGTEDFERLLSTLARRGDADLERVESDVRAIIAAVRSRGDVAVREFVQRFEKRTVDGLLIHQYGGAEALGSLPTGVRDALTEAASRIKRYHKRQVGSIGGFEYEEDGIALGTRVTPLDRVGIYVPGGKASYPSSVLMSVVPARVAGVRQIVVATPTASAEVRAACHLAGVDSLLDAGGAQAIAALAYGTETIPRVDKIVGPGNLYVAAAKRLVYGEVDIDSIAGPSEILVLADDSASPEVVAADLLSQAEHDEAAYPLLACTSAAFAEQVSAALERQLETLPRRAIAEAALRRQGACLVVADHDGLARVGNALAAEHVAVHTRDARRLADRIERAGALFVGSSTPEAAGDYIAGPSHVLPTGGAARYASPLGVYDFVSRTSIISYRPAALTSQAKHIADFARSEGLEAHARAVEVRVTMARG